MNIINIFTRKDAEPEPEGEPEAEGEELKPEPKPDPFAETMRVNKAKKEQAEKDRLRDNKMVMKSYGIKN